MAKKNENKDEMGFTLLTPEESKDAWDKFDEESIKKSEEFGDAFPIYKPYLGQVNIITLLSLPRPITTKLGPTFICDIEKEGMKWSMFATGRFRWDLMKIKKKLEITNEELVGKQYLLQRVRGIYKGEETTFLSLQLKE